MRSLKNKLTGNSKDVSKVVTDLNYNDWLLCFTGLDVSVRRGIPEAIREEFKNRYLW